MSSCMHEHEQFRHSHPFFGCFVPLSLLFLAHSFFSFFFLLLSGLHPLSIEFILQSPSAHQSFPLCILLSLKDRRGHVSIHYILHAVHALANCLILIAPIFGFYINSEIQITKLFNDMLRLCHNLTNRLEQANGRVIPAHLRGA